MDVGFDVAQWQPTKVLGPGDAALDRSYMHDLGDKLVDQTQALLQHPYDPNGWLRRSITLSRLRYPELAVGDAYKAMLLCQAHVARLDGNDCWRMGHRMGFWMQDETKEDADHVELLRSYLNKVQERADRCVREHTELFVDDPEVRPDSPIASAKSAAPDGTKAKPNVLKGKFRRRAYPWMLSRHAKRSDELLSTINAEFAEHSPKASNAAVCIVKRHAFGEGVGYHDTSELLGVFAAHDIRQGETILIDRSRIWGCTGPGINGDYANLNCGRGCYDLLHPNSESDDSDLDLRWIRDRAGKNAPYMIRNVKVLLCSIQDGCEHPLDHPLIARLTPLYAKDHHSKFSLQYDFAIPNEALQQFGIDIFANHNYDTWILFATDARARNNSCGDPIVDLLCPLFSLFNHSCAPNVRWQISEDHQSITATAGKDIRRGEQMFVGYDGFVEDQPLEERRKRLWDWLDSPCQCERCVVEEDAAKEAEYAGGKSVGEAQKPEWDLEDKPVFPEDFLNLKN